MRPTVGAHAAAGVPCEYLEKGGLSASPIPRHGGCHRSTDTELMTAWTEELSPSREVQREMRLADQERPSAQLPLVIYVLALGTFLMGTTEFVVTGLLPQIAGDLDVSVARAG